MKAHISATIDADLVKRVDRYRRAVRRSRSQVIELAVERLLRDETGMDQGLVVTSGRFQGAFSRTETYER
jgi:metal-responsive CopG/Arc/MetJ family transcriptional regulator